MAILVEITVKEDVPLSIVQDMVENLTYYLKNNIHGAIEGIAGEILADSTMNAPVKTGKLSQSLRTEAIEGGYAIVSSVKYTKYQEEGTKTIEAKFFIRGAVEKHQDEITAAIENLIREYFRGISVE